MALPVPAHYKHAKQGGQLLLCPDGFEFSKAKAEASRVHYVCRMKKKYGCRVTAAVRTADNMLVRVSGIHSHDTDLSVKRVQDKENQAIQEAARNPTVSPRSVLANLANELMEENPTSVNHLSKSKTFTKKIQRARNKLLACPEIPKTWDKNLVPEELQETASGDNFMICNRRPRLDEEKLVIGFCSPTGRETLDSSETWFGDGTFDVAKPTMFTQVFIIIAKSLTGKTVPCCYFMLPDKQFESYKLMFSVLREIGISPPRLFYSDFETGITKAMGDIFPETTIYCCDAHFKRAVRTNLQKHHLTTIYHSDESFQKFIRYFWGLSLVPVDDVVRIWDEFVLPACPELDDHAAEDNLHEFLSYLARTWIGPINQRTGARRNPIFRHELWNKTDAIENGDETTTNCSEGFNNAIQLSIPHNANVFSIIKQFRSENSLVEVKLRDAAVSPDPEASRTRRTNWAKRQEDLKHLVGNYDNLTTQKYMGYLMDYYNHTLNFV